MKHLLKAALAGLVLASAVLSGPSHAQGPAPTDPHMQWWRDARFGMFIHWGPVSLKGTEISISRSPNPYGPNEGGIPAAEYDRLYTQFNPVKFDPKAIVALAKAAGMKYIVFTAKHHDGFCEWDSKLTDYKVTSPESPYRKDIVKQLADATRAAGLHWCVYYSQPDLHNPDYSANRPAYNKYFHEQVRELLTNYGKVDLIWFDGLGASADNWDAANLFKEMRAINPNLIINDRCGLPGDYNSPEQRVGAYDDQHPWETCMTIGDQWAYKPDDSYKSAARCIQTLAKCAGGDGNLLLNIGPQPDGQVDPTQADRLKAIANWMKTRGVSITGTRGGPYKPTSSYVSTRKGDTVYVHVLRWAGESVALPAMPAAIIGSRVLGGGSVRVLQSPEGVSISVPEKDHDSSDTVIALQLMNSAMTLAAIPATVSGPAATVTASNIYHQIPTYDAAMAYDGDDGTRWATDDGVKQAWLQMDFKKNAVVTGVSISEAIESRVRKFEIQYQAPNGGEWITVAAGTQIGEHYTATFAPVTAKAFRLNILDSEDGPTISEVSFLVK